MRIATLYGVHGNIRALEAVLQEIPDDASIVIGGDVAVGPHPSETLEIAFLYGLPPTVQIDRVLFCHATPRNDVDVFTELTPDERIAPLFADVDADVVVCGHTHMQFERTIAGKRVINSGSVGMPYENLPGAYWTLDLEHRRTEYEPDEPLDLPAREEVLALFESRAV